MLTQFNAIEQFLGKLIQLGLSKSGSFCIVSDINTSFECGQCDLNIILVFEGF